MTRPDSTYTLRTTTRLVDVGVIALDRKGHPVTGLKREDFEIEDNGTPQAIRSFAPALGAASPQPARSAGASPSAEQYSNVVAAQSAPRTEEGNTTILMIDAANLAFSDLNYARSEILRFLKMLRPSAPVGLYVMKRFGYDVLLDPTTDADRVASTLKKWMPDAQDLANAQDEERRNRQQFDWVHSIDDLAFVNGNGEGKSESVVSSNGGAYALPADAKLRGMGSTPERNALYQLQGVSRQLASIPGRKELVWVSSVNVLADWSSQEVTKEGQGSKFLDTFGIQCEEALNNAHVSLYPLDASQLEAGGISADMGSRNVLAMGKTDRDPATASLGDAAPQMKPGRETAKMHEDTHPIQPIFRDLAEATGGHALRRAGDIAAELTGIVADGDAVYLLSFSPSGQPDDAYHHLTAKLVNHPELRLRYRTGYLYAKEPATLKDRFRDAVWRPVDMSDIAMTARAERDAKGSLIQLNIAAKDLDLKETGERWQDRLDIFIAERDDSDLHAKLTAKTLALSLRPATYQDMLRDGINFEERVTPKEGDGSFRVVVVDDNSGRMGSLTVPAQTLRHKN